MNPFTMVTIIVVASIVAQIVRTVYRDRMRGGVALPNEDLRNLRQDVEQLKAQLQEIKGRVDDQETLVDEAVSKYRVAELRSRQGQGGS